MSWAAHDIEPYLLRAKLGASISVPFCIIGSYSPDILTKWAVYGLDFSGSKKLLFSVLIALVIFLWSKNRAWAVSFVIGAWPTCFPTRWTPSG